MALDTSLEKALDARRQERIDEAVYQGRKVGAAVGGKSIQRPKTEDTSAEERIELLKLAATLDAAAKAKAEGDLAMRLKHEEEIAKLIFGHANAKLAATKTTEAAKATGHLNIAQDQISASLAEKRKLMPSEASLKAIAGGPFNEVTQITPEVTAAAKQILADATPESRPLVAAKMQELINENIPGGTFSFGEPGTDLFEAARDAGQLDGIQTLIAEGADAASVVASTAAASQVEANKALEAAQKAAPYIGSEMGGVIGEFIDGTRQAGGLVDVKAKGGLPGEGGESPGDKMRDAVLDELDKLEGGDPTWDEQREAIKASPEFAQFMQKHSISDPDIAMKALIKSFKADRKESRQQSRSAVDAAVLGGDLKATRGQVIGASARQAGRALLAPGRLHKDSANLTAGAKDVGNVAPETAETTATEEAEKSTSEPPTYRDVEGKNGLYTYRQHSDGRIEIIKSPEKASTSPDNPQPVENETALAAIGEEIGAFAESPEAKALADHADSLKEEEPAAAEGAPKKPVRERAELLAKELGETTSQERRQARQERRGDRGGLLRRALGEPEIVDTSEQVQQQQDIDRLIEEGGPELEELRTRPEEKAEAEALEDLDYDDPGGNAAWGWRVTGLGDVLVTRGEGKYAAATPEKPIRLDDAHQAAVKDQLSTPKAKPEPELPEELPEHREEPVRVAQTPKIPTEQLPGYEAFQKRSRRSKKLEDDLAAAEAAAANG